MCCCFVWRITILVRGWPERLRMNVLIVYAHPNPRSFNQAILHTLDAALRDRGHLTQTHDLYRMRFRAVLDSDDLNRNWRGEPAEDVRREQESVLWAQGLAFIYPIWWFGPPAILKGWIDRVFTRKFAFDFGAEGMKGLLTHERALILNTLGGDEASYHRQDWHELLARPMTEGILSVCGVRQVTHQAFYEVTGVTQMARRAMLEEVRVLAAAF